jgi:glycosyltransferase involved in cell wall biosynthesis
MNDWKDLAESRLNGVGDERSERRAGPSLPVPTYKANAASRMRFSIIIPTFKRAQLLGAAVQAALGQTYTDREILIVDDGSPDETPSVAATFGDSIRYLRQENKGKSAALNLGILASTGDVIIVLDDDDLFPPWTVAKHAEALARNRAADFSYGRFVRFRGDSAPAPCDLGDEEPVPTQDPRRLVVKLMENCFLPNPAWAVRRQAQINAGLYDEGMYYSHDYDMILRLARANEGVFVDDPVLYQRKHLSHRGPSAEETFMLDTVGKWAKYDALLFKKLDREWDLSDFRPFSDEEPSIRREALALLQKGVILFQRKVYDGAVRALMEYRRCIGGRSPDPVELKIAAGLLGCRYGIADLVSGESPSSEIVDAFRSGHWPPSIRAAFASQIRWRIRKALTLGEVGYAFRLATFSFKTFGFPATAAALGSRPRSGAYRWTASN